MFRSCSQIIRQLPTEHCSYLPWRGSFYNRTVIIKRWYLYLILSDEGQVVLRYK